MNQQDEGVPVVSCPHCGKPVTWSKTSPFRPFCSERCKLIDLGQWASEENRIPGAPALPHLDEFQD